MALHQYIGARYVPKFYENSLGTADWVAGVIYEPLTIVTWNGNSYTSKKTVPASVGDPSSNPDYWVATGVFNAQLADLSDRMDAVEGDVTTLNEKAGYYTPEMFGAAADGVTDDSAAFQDMIDAMSDGDRALIFGSDYMIANTVIVNKRICIGGLIRQNELPIIHTNMASGNLFYITSPSVGFQNIRVVGTGLGLNTVCAFYFDLDTIAGNGNIDAYLVHVGIQSVEYGVITLGRNLTAFDTGIGPVRRGFVFKNCPVTGAECRGHRIERCRFHGTSICIVNEIDAPNTAVKGITVKDCFLDGGTGSFVQGYGGGLVVENNTLFYLNAFTGYAVSLIKQTATEQIYDVFRDNTVLFRGANAGFITVADGCKTIIKGNTIQDGQRAAIYVHDGGETVVDGNVCLRNNPSSYQIAVDAGVTGAVVNNTTLGSAVGVAGGTDCVTANNNHAV